MHQQQLVGATADSPPSRINWFLVGFLAGAITAPFWAVILGPDPGINHPKLRGAR